MHDLREYVEDYVSQLTGPAADNAWHSLVEAGPAALPHVIEAFNTIGDAVVQTALVQVASEYRSAAAIPFLETSLWNGHAQIWKAALDGLVTLGGRAALDVLAAARETAIGAKREWIDEAVGQISEVERPG